MSQCQIVVWGYKHSISAAALPPGADLQIFMRSLKLVEIPLARGASSKGVETIAIAAGDSIPNMSLQTSPILCRRDENGVFRSAVKKVCVDDIFDAASSVESTALQALLPVSGCRSFIEACISLAEFVRVGLPNTRALTAAVTSLARPSRLRQLILHEVRVVLDLVCSRISAVFWNKRVGALRRRCLNLPVG